MRFRLILAVPCLLLAAYGCAPRSELAFNSRAEIADLPKKHQEEIAATLTELFGTQRFPKFIQAEVASADDKPSEKFDRLHLQHGRTVYLKECAGCHGVTGDGKGPAAEHLNPAPRDYRLGKFKFTSTPRGAKPRREDLARIIRRGAKGTSMPTFRWIAQEDLDAVIDYVLLLSTRGELEYRLHAHADQNLDEGDSFEKADISEQSQMIAQSWKDADLAIVRPLTPEPTNNAESVEAGARAFVQLNCYKCHGPDGRGNKEFNVGKDDWGRVAYAADLTTGMLHGGRRPVDIYRRIYAGINGTPMPAFAQPDTAKGESEIDRSNTIWHLTHFILSIVQDKPLPTDVINAEVKKQIEAQGQPGQATPSESTPAETPPAEGTPAEPKPEEPKPPADSPPAEAAPAESPPS